MMKVIGLTGLLSVITAMAGTVLLYLGREHEALFCWVFCSLVLSATVVLLLLRSERH